MRHHDHRVHDLLLVLAQEFQAQEEEQPEVCEDVRVLALHQLNVVLCQLERRFLEVHVAGTARNYETEIYVDNVALRVH